MSLDKEFRKKILLIPQPFFESTIFPEYVTSKKPAIFVFMKMVNEIRDFLVEKIKKRELPSFERDIKEIIDIIERNLSSNKLGELAQNMDALEVDTRELLLDLAEILDVIPDKYGVLKLISHAIRALLYYKIEKNPEALLRITYLILYLIAAYSILMNKPKKDAERLYHELILPAYEKEMDSILKMITS